MTYLDIFDVSGNRITSYVFTIHGETLDALKKLAIKNYPDSTAVETDEAEHAQYLSGKYKYDVTTKSAVEIQETDLEKLETIKSSKLSEIQSLLTQTDYQAIKFAEGIINEEQYNSLKTLRESWRSAYNSIQSALTLDAVNAVTYSTDIPVIESI